MPKTDLCKDCINFILAGKNDLVTCDYEYWENEPFYQAIFNTSQMHNCIYYEHDPEFTICNKINE